MFFRHFFGSGVEILPLCEEKLDLRPRGLNRFRFSRALPLAAIIARWKSRFRANQQGSVGG